MSPRRVGCCVGPKSLSSDPKQPDRYPANYWQFALFAFPLAAHVHGRTRPQREQGLGRLRCHASTAFGTFKGWRQICDVGFT